MKALRSPARGSTSLVALVTIATLAFIAGSFIVRITNRSREAYHSASWIEASQAAESAAAVALAEIRRVVPDTGKFPTDAWSGWDARSGGAAASVPTDHDVPADMTLSLTKPLTLTHVGEGNNTCTAAVTVEAPAALVDSAGQQWFRVRATGTAGLPGSSRTSLSAADRTLRRLAFVRDWSTGKKVASPQVSRSVEWIVRPAPPFEAALQAVGAITANSSGNVVDSYDSTDATKSTGREYDSAKRQSHGDLCSNSTGSSFNGTVLGDVSTNGAAPSGTSYVSGTVNTAHYNPLAPVIAPDWGFIMNIWSVPVSQASTAVTSTTGIPAHYHLSYVSSTLVLKANRNSSGALLPSKVELWIDGDLTGGITVEDGVQATIYVAGNVNVKSGSLVNPSLTPANLQIYGIQPATGSTRSISLNMNSDLHASIYAPGHSLAVSGNGDLMGSFTAASIKLSGTRQVHFDESLARSAAVTVDYRLASWIEDVPAGP